jgi:DNA adenine methylase
VFLALDPGTPALLNDANAELMQLYRMVRDFPLALMDALDGMARQYDEAFYYRTRESRPEHPVEQAARFLFLNKTCFNGLYRTNTKGAFNVPFGKYKRCPQLYERANVLEVSYRLRGVQIFSTDFEAILDSAEKGDLVYCDPPYLPQSATAHFSEYTAAGFAWEQHVRLRDACDRAAARGAHVVISNAAVPVTSELYAGWRLHELEVAHNISAKADKRGRVKELVARPALILT